MAYVTKYQLSFTNEASQLVEIYLKQKDGVAGTVQEYAVVNAKLAYDGDEGKFNPIFGMSLDVEFDIQEGDMDYWPSFATATKDQWQAVVIIDSKEFFWGYVLPDEGAVPFQDRPYSARITAVDGIGLLRDVDLIKPDGTQFNTHHAIIEYIAACLLQTGQQLPIRVYDNLYHSSFANRDADFKNDMVSQTYLEYRTFLKDATTFDDCYTVLEKIFTDTFRCFQWNGRWVIIRLGMMQYFPFVGYYTEYDAQGQNGVGYEMTEGYGMVGKNDLIYPHGEDQVKYVKKAVKSSESEYKYEIWPEIPKNNKFERGTAAGTAVAYDSSDIDGDGDFTEVIGTIRKYQVADWEWGEFNQTNVPAFTMSHAGTSQPLTHRIFNIYDVEIIREVMIPGGTSGGLSITGIKSEAIPVIQGDRIKFGVDKRFDVNLAESNSTNISGLAVVYIVPVGGGTPWFLLNSYTDLDRNGRWMQTSNMQTINVQYGDTDTRKYAGVSLESQPIPVDGDLRIILINEGLDGNLNYYRNFEFDYFPMVAGGFREVKSESRVYTQTAQNWPDKSKGEIFLSDNLHKVFKGCLLGSDGVPLSANWFRMGENAFMSYAAWVNFFRFQLEQRRYLFIEGSFSGLMYAPVEDQETYEPLGLHKQYRFTDVPLIDQRFILGAPLEMDLVKAWITGKFYEVYIDSKIFFDGERSGTATFKYNF